MSTLIDSQPYLQTHCPGTQYVVLQRLGAEGLDTSNPSARNNISITPLKKSESIRKMKNIATFRTSFSVKPQQPSYPLN